MKYNVTYSAISVGSVDVEADSPEEAFDLAKEKAKESAGYHDHLELDWPPSEANDGNNTTKDGS